MSGKLSCAVLVASIVGCRGGHVTEVGQSPHGLGDYESAVVRVGSGRDVAAKNDELVQFEGELIQHLQDAKVFARISREDPTAQLLVNVIVVKVDDTENPLDINNRKHADVHATVDVIDRSANRRIGQFAVDASDTDRPTVIVGPNGTARTIALRNVARAVSRKLKASR